MKLKPPHVIPGLLVLAVVLLSYALPSAVRLPSSRGVDFGYGFPPAPINYHPMAPQRILDTRINQGGFTLGQGMSEDIQVSGAGGVPTTATSAAINVTVTNTTAASYLTVFPTGSTRPLASNLNWTAGKTVPNLVEITLGTGGKLTIFNFAGSVDVIFDVQGFSAPPTGTPTLDGLFKPLVPARILDTRNGTGAPTAMLGGGQTLTLQVSGANSVPNTGVEAAVLNITVTNPSGPGYITVFPTGASQPLASNLNFVAGQTVPNRVIVKLGTGGKVSLFNSATGPVDLIADANGWFTDGTISSSHGAIFAGTSPSRILDTRNGTGGFNSPIGPNSMITVQVAGADGVPPAGVKAAVLNATVTEPTSAGYLTLWPDGNARPLASDLNFVNGLTVPNLVIVQLGANGSIDIYNSSGFTHVVVDVVGWYQGG